jgi:hypothetical protein
MRPTRRSRLCRERHANSRSAVAPLAATKIRRSARDQVPWCLRPTRIFDLYNDACNTHPRFPPIRSRKVTPDENEILGSHFGPLNRTFGGGEVVPWR